MFCLHLLAAVVPTAVLGHGGLIWPPVWQDGVGVSPQEWGKKQESETKIDYVWTAQSCC